MDFDDKLCTLTLDWNAVGQKQVPRIKLVFLKYLLPKELVDKKLFAWLIVN